MFLTTTYSDTYLNKVFSYHFMTKKYTIIIEKDEAGWLVSEVVELPGCHTQAKSMDELLKRTKEAIQAYLKTSEEPEISDEFIGVQHIEV